MSDSTGQATFALRTDRTAGRRLRTVVFAVALSIAGLGMTACGKGPTKGDCDKLLDHVIDIEINAAGGDKLTPEMKADLDNQKAELRKFLGKQFMDKCYEKTPKGFVACGLKAKTPEEFAACDKQ